MSALNPHTMRVRSARPVPLHMWAALPELPGCYCIWTSSGVPLYVGRAGDLKHRLRARAAVGWWLSGYGGSTLESIKHRLKQAPRGALLTTWVVADVEASKRLELLLIGILAPLHNRMPNAESACVLRVLQGGGQ